MESLVTGEVLTSYEGLTIQAKHFNTLCPHNFEHNQWHRKGMITYQIWEFFWSKIRWRLAMCAISLEWHPQSIWWYFLPAVSNMLNQACPRTQLSIFQQTSCTFIVVSFLSTSDNVSILSNVINSISWTLRSITVCVGLTVHVDMPWGCLTTTKCFTRTYTRC